MKGYKGFNKGLVCRGKQYTENTIFEEENAEICKNGMHFCENPFDVLDYYDLLDKNAEFNDFAEVESLEEAKTDDSKKYCTTKLKIGAKLSFGDFIKACIDFTLKKTCIDIDYAQIGSSGYDVKIGNSGDCVKIGNSGDDVKIGNSGNCVKINSSGKNSVICCAGNNSIVKAKKGSWITLSEWKYQSDKYVPICVKTEFVDGERIKEDVFYELKNGEFVENKIEKGKQ